MDYQVSARKYRPGTFEDVIGQPHVVQTLVNAIATKRIAHAFLFSGTRGVGKTTVARLLAKALNCEHGPTGTPCGTCPNCLEIAQGTSMDVIEIDGASNTGVDDVREIRENVKFTPFRGHYRVYIIDEVHMLSNSAFNALLKTLEEPPAHVVFVFATTEIHKIPPTILSRCQHYNFRRIARSEIIQRLRHVAEHEGITVEDRSLASLARASEGSMRDALSLLDQAVAFGGKTVRHTDLEILLGSVPQEHVRAMISAIIAQDSPAAVRAVAHLLDQGHDLRTYCGDLVEHVRNLLVAAVVPSSQELQGLIELSKDEVRQIETDAKAFTAEQLQELFRIFSQAEDALRLSAHPRFVLEVAAVRATRLLLPATQASSASPAPPAAPRPRASQSEPRRDTPVPGQPTEKAPRSEPVRAASGQGGHPAPRQDAVHNPQTQTPAPEPAKPAISFSASWTAGSSEQSGQPANSPAAKPASQTGGVTPDSRRVAAPVAADPPVRLNWEQILERVASVHPNIGPFLEMGTLVTIEGNLLTIGYPKTASVALARIQNDENLRLVTDICAELAGRPVRLRVIELADGRTTGLSLAQIRAAKERDQKQALLERTRSHPLVKQTLDVFGGELVEVRQVSPQKEVR
ncbi:MAG: DNA polymerase III subunit gamma/tau [Nitrospirota bacterium]